MGKDLTALARVLSGAPCYEVPEKMRNAHGLSWSLPFLTYPKNAVDLRIL